MKFVIQEADLRRDRGVLIATMQRYLTPLSNEDRFDWLYSQNPHGPTRAWLARDGETGEVVGTSAAFSRKAILDGIEKHGWVLGDFCMADKYRTLGPALQLQRATLKEVESDETSDFYYDFPSREMMAVYKRCSIAAATQMVRLAKPLRFHPKRKERSDLRLWSQLSSVAGNFLLRTLDTRFTRAKPWKIAPHEGSCGREFTALKGELSSSHGFAVQRSAEYLNWRYLRHPSTRYEIITARSANELHGYLIFSREGKTASIAEWCVKRNRLLKVLIWELIRKLRKTEIMTLNAFLPKTDSRIPLFRSMGFWRRESSPVVVHWPRFPFEAPARLLLMHGDRDS